jgi:hypothetical protein
MMRKYLNMLIGRELVIKKTVSMENEWYGSNYGGFFVHPLGLNEESLVYSFGVGEDISFDKEIILRHRCCVFAFDPTPRCINWIKSQIPRKRFHL